MFHTTVNLNEIWSVFDLQYKNDVREYVGLLRYLGVLPATFPALQSSHLVSALRLTPNGPDWVSNTNCCIWAKIFTSSFS